MHSIQKVDIESKWEKSRRSIRWPPFYVRLKAYEPCFQTHIKWLSSDTSSTFFSLWFYINFLDTMHLPKAVSQIMEMFRFLCFCKLRTTPKNTKSSKCHERSKNHLKHMMQSALESLSDGLSNIFWIMLIGP